MKVMLERLVGEALAKLSSADSTTEAVSGLKTEYLGRKGVFAGLLKELAGLDPDKRREAGALINDAKRAVEEKADALLADINRAELEEKLSAQRLDITLPGTRSHMGSLHPVTQILNEVERIFSGMGFEVAEGPEIESEYYNFESLNIPADHPARDMQDTFYVSGGALLRTHTSPVQTRVMEKRRPPLRIIAPGTVYRRDSDITHTPMFHQVEGFMVDKGISFADLKGVLTAFLRELFGTDIAVRFRPSFFPFTEPSAEVDIRCVICTGKGCRVCKGTGWLEILGSGMIHPEVFRHAGIDIDECSGFAFGVGIERVAMLKFGIDDLRLFFENDLKFLRQF